MVLFEQQAGMDCQDWCMTYRTVGQPAQIIIQQVDNTKPEYESHPAPVLYGIYIPPAMRTKFHLETFPIY